ncbi:hypothetical protein NLU13_7820 [Sarocladium strictum]|uniref:CFEM domain-containing protein n=1 Tax=Sarocladium strictum TaxID=5046 RepID=A0AA39GF05_SARSR|nr:hypothetical protein NLU13_7820 [Sarocladium strictum]
MRVLPFLLLNTLPLALAQGDLSSTLGSYPSCAQPCILTAITGGLCSPLDSFCICNNDNFRTNVTECVQASCTVIDALGTKNTSLTSCGAPVRDRSHHLAAHTYTLFAFAMLMMVIRIGYKLVMRLDFGMDDWLLIASAVTVIAETTIAATELLPNGMGRDIWTLRADQITNFLKFWYVIAIIYFLQTCLVKLAFIAFYMRIFTTQSTRRILWATFVAVAAWGLSFIFVGIFVCNPVSYIWTLWDGQHKGKCVSDAAYVWANAGSNIGLDIWVLAIPLWEVRKLQLHWKKKFGVALMFSLGACVTVMSILRLQSLIQYQKKDNVTSEFADVFVWSSIEIGVGIICACLPTLRLLLVKVWPILAGTTVRDSHHWYRQSGKASEVSRSTRHSVYGKPLPATPTNPGLGFDRRYGVSRTISINGRNVSSKAGKPAGIAVEESFVMETHEQSDISLILIKPDGKDGRSNV